MNILFVIPNDIDLPTGGYRYDRAIVEGMRALGHNVELLCLKGDYPFPSLQEKKAALEIISKQKDFDVAVIDGLAGGCFPELLQKLGTMMPLAALVHHPLCLETGLTEEQASDLRGLEQAGLQYVRHVITTGPRTAEIVCEIFAIDENIVSVVEPGVERSGISSGSNNSTVNLLCVASVIPRKGHRVLLQALARLSSLDWKLDCVGMRGLDDTLDGELDAFLKAHSMQDRITFHGALSDSELEKHYRKADLFVLPSFYEGYGMVFSEAIVRGIPVVACNAGAIPQTVPNGCGILVEPGDVDALVRALASLISVPDDRETLRLNCFDNEPDFPTWERSAKAFAASLGALV